MSFVVVAPEMLTYAATHLVSIGSTISAANAAAAAQTTGMLAPAADEVSAAVTTLFSGHAQQFQALSAQAAAFHTEFVQALNGAVGSYAATEAANASPLQTLEQNVLAVINLPTDVVLGRPLIGAGTNGTTNAQGIGTPGGGGGILIGSGGNGGDSIAAGVPGGAGGPAGLIGTGGTGGVGGLGATGGAGGTGGWLWGNGGSGGIGGPGGTGGIGGSALWFGSGGPGGLGGELGGTGGTGGSGGLVVGNGGAGGNGGVSGGPGGVAGGPGGAGGVARMLGAHGATGAVGGAPTVPLQFEGGRVVTDISVGGGPNSQVWVDTGSTGVLVPPQDVNFTSLGAPTATGLTANYGDSLFGTTETYNTYTALVNFGNGIITEQTTIGVVTSITQTNNGVTTTLPVSDGFPIVGVGANTNSFSGLSTGPVQALPGNLSQGVLLNVPGGALEFGANPLASYASVSGAPVSTLDIRVNGNTSYDVYPSYIDSGGAYGAIPERLIPGSQVGGYVPAGDTIYVYTSNGQTLLYSQTVTGTAPDLPSILSNAGGQFNSGFYPFTQIPIYLSYSPSGTGTISFDT